MTYMTPSSLELKSLSTCDYFLLLWDQFRTPYKCQLFVLEVIY